MAKKIFITKSMGVLRPYDPESVSVVHKWKDGNTYALTYKEARNPNFHRLAFAVAQMVVDNAPEESIWSGRTAKSFINAVQLTYGFTEDVINLDGEVHSKPLSISFEQMGQEEFEKIFTPLVKEAARILNCTEHDILTNMEQS